MVSTECDIITAAATLASPIKTRFQHRRQGIPAAFSRVARSTRKRFSLSEDEELWVDLQKSIESAGYALRPRYRPGWVGSWVGTNKKAEECEDSIGMGNAPIVMDATRISDGVQVLLKLWINNERDGPEMGILRYFSDPSRVNDPCNHCVPLLDSFSLVGLERAFEEIIVEPLLRDWRYPPFYMVAEALSFMLQLIEGLEYMHSHNVAHGDIHAGNIMMDPKDMFPKGFHGAFNYDFRARDYDTKRKLLRQRTRLQSYVKYFYIDFGSSAKFGPGEAHSVRPAWTFWECPEMRRKEGQVGQVAYDPFKADVYALGLTLLTEIQKRTGLEFVLPTLLGMIAENPDDRPSMRELKLSFHSMLVGLSHGQMRRRIGWIDDDNPFVHPEAWGEYLRLLWQSYRYGLTKDIITDRGGPWWRFCLTHQQDAAVATCAEV
ncbi:kinase-like protein [Calocera cornea HHB12733]|uniref:Kinase-like protein n=1 Tax=Calocera cornea HHB12733 TaxID=1353952 RepID=A0A165FB28_9BASI|nr:kinase-like protein [Calocera cornea HHB12733]